MTERPAIDLFEAIHSTRAIRYLKPDPIPDEVIFDILDAAIRGPSGANTQQWGWVVVTDPEVKAKIAVWYREAWGSSYGMQRDELLARFDEIGRGTRRNFLAAEYLAEHIEEAPVWIFAVLTRGAGSANPRLGSSIYGAVQNLMLAARGHGVGTSLTTFHTNHEDDVRELLGIPDEAITMALIPLGYPARGTFSEPSRRPVERVAHRERWGVPFEAPDASGASATGEGWNEGFRSDAAGR